MMRFESRDAAEEWIISRKGRGIKTTQCYEIVRCAFETEYRVAVYDVRSVSPFRMEFSHYVTGV